MLASVIVTVKNESANIAGVLEDLLAQEKPFEILIVDAASTDGTQGIVEGYSKKHPEVKLLIHPGSRGESRNYGVSQANGDIVAFTDGGCGVDKNWLCELKNTIASGFDVAAGKTISIGPYGEDMERVGVEHKGFDVSYPSCNLAYKKVLFLRIGGFDAAFITAEDIDLNLRAVDAGGRIGYNEKAVVERHTAPNLKKYAKQAFWYGYGRKQLTLKHGNLWSSYSFSSMLKGHLSFKGSIRLFYGFLGYLRCKFERR
ncbi:MAG: glycosyl transferase family 2 [Thermoplasmata archaeon HGW-Thermoplasmata-1]|nr:MAG: glycosyl transferase family 2 [Thermoplasmata archaeon HGW-Thermoplasmata-1]